ncbi:hypothetical protein SAMN04488698_10314 [Candidatus Frackibacter sp. WG12]|nr:MAG: hypothetical protein AWU54_1711 [Candidatus Frackibacter sp. T328-2]SDC50414.1 hypothetical protein SAMN04515661_11214 [Candidatus Frackibacter sp. WG11]SEM40338.1 hypothetical protein SAMN04488698_10314 [Candidatus Frackibacter sp. WG12]SFL74716.1 hypothetical protein SAMN04488699_11212 [Candidatus Frackibacter sp. WG13]
MSKEIKITQSAKELLAKKASVKEITIKTLKVGGG